MNTQVIHRARVLTGVAGAALSLLAAGACRNPAEPDPAGITVVSTSKGVVSDRKARELNVGGELLCTVS